jgi:hypothetical protein
LKSRCITVCTWSAAPSTRLHDEPTGGLWSGLIVCLAFLGVAGYLVALGHDIAGTFIGTVDLIALVSIFVYGRQSQEKERQKKSEVMAGKGQR